MLEFSADKGEKGVSEKRERRMGQMKFIEMTGSTLAEIVNDGELHVADLGSAGVKGGSIVRINQQGDIEVRKTLKWDVVGGLLGNFEERVRKATGLDWA